MVRKLAGLKSIILLLMREALLLRIENLENPSDALWKWSEVRSKEAWEGRIHITFFLWAYSLPFCCLFCPTIQHVLLFFMRNTAGILGWNVSGETAWNDSIVSEGFFSRSLVLNTGNTFALPCFLREVWSDGKLKQESTDLLWLPLLHNVTSECVTIFYFLPILTESFLTSRALFPQALRSLSNSETIFGTPSDTKAFRLFTSGWFLFSLNFYVKLSS